MGLQKAIAKNYVDTYFFSVQMSVIDNRGCEKRIKYLKQLDFKLY